jgi:LmbE family N-acetylglucosaminyl deacetylase
MRGEHLTSAEAWYNGPMPRRAGPRDVGAWPRLAVAALLSACGSTTTAEAPRPGILVLAPHPDDETLIGAAPIAAALAEGRPLRVAWMTNGDLSCARDGWLRQREAIAAIGVLGVPEERAAFLGYPDGFLDALGGVPLAPLERRGSDGSCARGATTYAGYGEHASDLHRALTGASGAYTAENAIGDLVALLERDRPADVYTSHPIDTHPDHATTYVLLRRALERARLAVLPRIHRAIVHAGPCWPNGSGASPCPEIGPATWGSPFPPLPAPLEGYVPNERMPSPDRGARARRAIAEHRSQLHGDVERHWLATFARPEAIYWTETLAREGDRVVRAGAAGAAGGAVGPRTSSPPPAEREAVGGRTAGTAAEGHEREERSAMSQRAPLRVAFDARVPADGAARVRVLARASDLDAGYALAIVGGHTAVVYGPRGRELASIHVPDDGARRARHRWELRVDPRADDGGAVELEVRRGGALIGVAVDADPFLEGDTLLTGARGGAEVGAVDVAAIGGD